MSVEAALAMKAVLQEIGGGGEPFAPAPLWFNLLKLVNRSGPHTDDPRKEAARKLIGNHEAVLKDLTNPSPTQTSRSSGATPSAKRRSGTDATW